MIKAAKILILVSLLVIAACCGGMLGMQYGYEHGERNGILANELMWLLSCVQEGGKTIRFETFTIHCGYSKKS